MKTFPITSVSPTVDSLTRCQKFTQRCMPLGLLYLIYSPFLTLWHLPGGAAVPSKVAMETV